MSSSLLCLCEGTLPTESKDLGVQGWPAHSPPDATKRREVVTHRQFSPPQILSAQWESALFRAGGSHTGALSSGGRSQPRRIPQLCPIKYIFDVGLIAFGVRLEAPALPYDFESGDVLRFSSVLSDSKAFFMSISLALWLSWAAYMLWSDVEEAVWLVGRLVCLSAALPAKRTVYSERRRIGWNLWLARVGVWVLRIKWYDWNINTAWLNRRDV